LDNEGIVPKLTYQNSKIHSPNIINSNDLATVFTPEFGIYLSKQNIYMPITSNNKLYRNSLRTSREERIKELNAEISTLLNNAALSINETTQNMNDNMAAAFFNFDPNALFTGANIQFDFPPYQISFGPGSSEGPSTNVPPNPPPGPTPGAGIDIGGTIGYVASIIGTPATAGILGAAAVIYSIAMPIILVNKIADEARELREEKVNSISTSLKELIEKTQQEFIDNGWEPLSEDDGYNIKFALDFYNNPNPEQQKKIVEDRLLKQLSITGNRWYIPGIYNGLLDHWSFGVTGKSHYTPIPIGAIVHSRAYVTISMITTFKDKTKKHQHKEYLKFLQRNHYEWEYNFFKNEEYHK